MIGDRKNISGGFTPPLRARAGFTLVEMLVAVGIFVIVITLVSTIYISALSSQRKAFGLQNVLDSSRFALESVARAIRQSDVVSATQTSLELSHPTKGQIFYTLSNGRFLENGQPLISENVVVEELQFLTRGVASGDGEQPRITLLLRVRSGNADPQEQSTIRIQTTITQRNLQF